MICALILVIFFIFPNQIYSENEQSITYFKQAEELFSACLFEQSIPYFEQALSESSLNGTDTAIAQNHLAKCLFLTRAFQNAVCVLKSLDPTEESLKLLGRCYRELKKYDRSIKTFEKGLKCGNHNKFSFEIGLTYFESENNIESKKWFEPLWHHGTEANIRILSGIYLTHLYIKENFLDKSHDILESIKKIIPQNDPLSFEINYLEGKIAYLKNDFLNAISHFSSSLSNNRPRKQPWEETARLYLGWSYLHCSHSLSHLKEAEYLFSEIYQENGDEQALLGLGTCFSSQFQLSQDKSLLEKAHAIFDQLNFSISPEIRFQALYIRAEIAPTPEERSRLFYQMGQAYPSGSSTAKMVLLMGKLLYKHQQYKEADDYFTSVWTHHPQADETAEALFWSARSQKKIGLEESKIKNLYNKIYTDYPDSFFAPEAYFFMYDYQDYLQGSRTAIKHLKGFEKHYSSHPLYINVCYLLGMDKKRNRKSPSGKWIQKKNFTSSIDAFTKGETLFESLVQNNKMDAHQIEKYTPLYYRMKIERGITNLSIAGESQGAKKQIFFDYAETVFKSLVSGLENPYLEESLYYLAVTLLKAMKNEEADNVLSTMIEKYQSDNITKGYYLSRAWYQKGVIALQQKKDEEALHAFTAAEDAARGKILTTDEKLDLLIQQSCCHKRLNHTEQAMLILSRVINDHAVSSLRVKAMYLRAKLYEQQGREELARKQLEALSKHGGEWAKKAKEKLNHATYHQ